MSESSSDEDFGGFHQEDIDVASHRYNQRLIRQGIGDEYEISDYGGESEESDSEDHVVDASGDHASTNDTNGWHDNFNYFERGPVHLFNPRGNTGPTQTLGPDKEPVDFFSLFVSDEILQYIIEETNRYALKEIAEHPDQNKAPWIIPSLQEMKTFLGLCFLMGINVKPDIKSYWTTDVVLETPYFGKTMKRDRFQQIMRYLHFSNCLEAPEPGTPNYDVLYKVKFLMEMFNKSMLEQYIPKRQVSVDEVMVPFKGRLSFKQYMPAKPTKWGIKMWALAEASTGYMTHCRIYSGKSHLPAQGLGSQVVKTCIEKSNLAGQGYHVYMDNFFTSPALLEDLYQNCQTGACGTVRLNRKGLPKDIMKKKPEGVEHRGDMTFKHKGSLSAVVWKDKRNVSVISTIHNQSVSSVKRMVQQPDGMFSQTDVACPQMVVDYINFMGGVDRTDQYIQYYNFQHKTLKWPKRIFFTMLEILKYNAYRLFSMSPNHQPGPGKTQLTFLQFSKSVATGLIAGYAGGAVRKGRPALVPVDHRLTQRHLPATLETRSWCHVCYMKVKAGSQEKRAQTKYGCRDCGKHLCLPGCFTAFHSVKNYY